MGGLDVLEECTRMPVGFCILVRVYYCKTGELGSLSSSLWISKRGVHKGGENTEENESKKKPKEVKMIVVWVVFTGISLKWCLLLLSRNFFHCGAVI